MSNPLYNMMNRNTSGLSGFMQKLNQLKSMGGDPQKQIQQMLSSGRVTQEQYNQAVRQAQALQRMLGGR